MTDQMNQWVRESAATLFAVPNLRGSIIVNFDTESGALKPVVHTSAQFGADSERTTHALSP